MYKSFGKMTYGANWGSDLFKLQNEIVNYALSNTTDTGAAFIRNLHAPRL